MFSFVRVAVVTVSLHSNRTLTKAEVVTMELGIFMTVFTMLLVGRMCTLAV